MLGVRGIGEWWRRRVAVEAVDPPSIADGAARRLARRPEAAGRPASGEIATGALARERDVALSVDPVDAAEHDEEAGDTVHRAARSLHV